MDFDRLNDGSGAAPRLRMQHSQWSLIGLPFISGPDGAPEWTLDEKFARIKAAGFTAIEYWLNAEDEGEVKAALERHALS